MAVPRHLLGDLILSISISIYPQPCAGATCHTRDLGKATGVFFFGRGEEGGGGTADVAGGAVGIQHEVTEDLGETELSKFEFVPVSQSVNHDPAWMCTYINLLVFFGEGFLGR